MNAIFYALGIESWKSVAAALVLPPLPLMMLVVAGAMQQRRRPRLGGTLLAAGCCALWLSMTPAAADALADALVPSPPALDAAMRQRLKTEASPRTAIVVVGGGRRDMALEYGSPSPGRWTIERLRYGLWLARQTGLPVAYTGGIAHRGEPGASEAEVADRVAREEFGVALAWAEGRSRDTSENGRYTVPLLHGHGVERIVLVTHGFHMRRALRAFERAAAAAGTAPLQIVPAPVGLEPRRPLSAGDWLPSTDAALHLRVVLHEWLGWLAGA